MTYSIVAREKETGLMGVAVQSHWFSVGSVVTWGKAGVGVVATQSMVDVSYGPLGLALMSSGKSATESLSALLKADSRPEVRQVAMIDSKGRVSVHSGEKCIPYAGHYVGDQFSCEANLMRNETVWGTMAKDFEENSSNLEFSERLISALEAGEKAGGDVRGKQSAAILVVSSAIQSNSWSGRLVDLRVEDHPDPVHELKRLLRLHRGYEWANKGDEFLTAGKFDESLKAYEKAGQYAPEIEELQFWRAVSLVQAKRLEEAEKIFRSVFSKNKDWLQVLKTLPRVGMLPSDLRFLNEVYS